MRIRCAYIITVYNMCMAYIPYTCYTTDLSLPNPSFLNSAGIIDGLELGINTKAAFIALSSSELQQLCQAVSVYMTHTLWYTLHIQYVYFVVYCACHEHLS